MQGRPCNNMEKASCRPGTETSHADDCASTSFPSLQPLEGWDMNSCCCSLPVCSMPWQCPSEKECRWRALKSRASPMLRSSKHVVCCATDPTSGYCCGPEPAGWPTSRMCWKLAWNLSWPSNLFSCGDGVSLLSSEEDKVSGPLWSFGVRVRAACWRWDGIFLVLSHQVSRENRLSWLLCYFYFELLC